MEAWVAHESLSVYAMYLKDVETAFNRPQRNNDSGVRKEKLSVFAQIARPFGDLVKGESFTKKDMEVAHWFILNNCDEALPYLEEHEQLMKQEHPSHLYAKKHRELFPSWFHGHVSCMCFELSIFSNFFMPVFKFGYTNRLTFCICYIR